MLAELGMTMWSVTQGWWKHLASMSKQSERCTLSITGFVSKEVRFVKIVGMRKHLWVLVHVCKQQGNLSKQTSLETTDYDCMHLARPDPSMHCDKRTSCVMLADRARAAT